MLERLTDRIESCFVDMFGIQLSSEYIVIDIAVTRVSTLQPEGQSFAL